MVYVQLTLSICAGVFVAVWVFNFLQTKKPAAQKEDPRIEVWEHCLRESNSMIKIFTNLLIQAEDQGNEVVAFKPNPALLQALYSLHAKNGYALAEPGYKRDWIIGKLPESLETRK